MTKATRVMKAIMTSFIIVKQLAYALESLLLFIERRAHTIIKMTDIKLP